MSYVAASYRVNAATLSVGRRFYSRCYQRFPDLCASAEAVAWSRTLDWRDNPYSRFLLRRELLRFVTARAGTDPRHDVFRLASSEEVAAMVDYMLDTCPEKLARGVFNHVVTSLPWKLSIKAGRVRYSHLTKALAHQSAHAA